MVTRLILTDELGRVRILADWRHGHRLEPFILGNLVDGGVAYAVSLRTDTHFIDTEVPPAARTDDHCAMLRQAREPAIRAFCGSAHRLTLDYTRGADGSLHAHAAYATKLGDDGMPSFAAQVAMPDEVIDGTPRPLYRRTGDAFERYHRGAWVTHESHHTRHQLTMEPSAWPQY